MSENPTFRLPAFLDEETQERLRIMQESAAAAAAETAALGLPATHVRDGRVVWVYPDGRATTEMPPELREAMDHGGKR